MVDRYKHKRTSVTLIRYHFVWIPRRRRKVLIGDVEKRLKDLLLEITQTIECEVVAMEVMPDYVHLFLNAPPTLSPDQIMHRIKGASSRALRQEFPHLLKMPSMWTRSYYCGTAGDASSETIKNYIANQSTTD